MWENRTDFFLREYLLISEELITAFSFLIWPEIFTGVALAERIVLYTLTMLLHPFNWKVPEGHVLDL